MAIGLLSAELWHAEVGQNRALFEIPKNRLTSPGCYSAQERKFKNRLRESIHLEPLYTAI